MRATIQGDDQKPVSMGGMARVAGGQVTWYERPDDQDPIWGFGLSADGLRQASQYFDSAIALEPRFAHALAAKASVIAPLAYFGYASRDSVVASLRSSG